MVACRHVHFGTFARFSEVKNYAIWLLLVPHIHVHIKLFTFYICHMNGSVEPKSQDTPNGSAVLVGDQHDGGSAELGEEQLSDDR